MHRPPSRHGLSSSSTQRATRGRHALVAAVEALEPRTLLAAAGLSAVYYDNADFAAIRVRRTDSTVDFNWGTGTPDVSVDADTFSVRWTGKVTPQFSQTYTFYTTTDEAVRLWVNGQLLIDNLTPHSSTENSGTIALTAGQSYAMKMEYAEFTGQAIAQLSWSSASQAKQIIPASALTTDAQAPTTPANLAVNMKADTNVLLQWDASTDDVGVQAYNVYRDGIKVGSTTATRFNDTGRAPGGTYVYTVRAFDGYNNLSNPSTGLNVTTNPAGYNGLSAVYYDDDNLSAIKVKRTDRRILCDWGAGSPDPSIGSDTFSIRWSGQVQPEFSQTYTFFAPSDDGVRLWVNSQLIINDFNAGASERSGTIALTAGQKYSLKMEYFDGTGNAAVQLLWASASQAKTVIPTGRLFADAANPTTPTNLRLTGMGAGTANIAWDASTDDVLVQAYNVYRNGLKIGSTTTTAWADTGLTPGQTYTYTVRALDGYNNLSNTTSGLAVTPSAAPSKPGTPSLVDKTDTTVDISWSASTDDVAVTAYNVYRNGSFIGSTATTSYHDTSLSSNTTYTYTVKATDGSGNLSVASDPLAVTTDASVGNWWNTNWHYRTAITANTGSYSRSNRVTERDINFTQVLSGLGRSGSLIENSIRVIETTADGSTVLNAAVPFQFEKASSYNASSNASGTLVFKLVGSTNANVTRYYHVYFDTAGSFAAPSFTAEVVTTDNVTDEGQTSVRTVTSTATYYYQKENGGFSSIVDASGNDWLSFNPTAGSGSAGEYRGLPNAVYPGGGFHPGFYTGSTQILYTGPLRTSLVTTSSINKGSGFQTWQMRWDIYADHATCTVLVAPSSYWFLFEGTPGGAIDGNDYSVRSDGTWTDINTAWTDNDGLGTSNGNEWVYFGDSAINKYLYLAHHEADAVVDSYYNMEGNMTVFGFGRNGGNSYLSGTNQHFTIGIANGGTYSAAATLINGAYKPLTVNQGVSQNI